MFATDLDRRGEETVRREHPRDHGTGIEQDDGQVATVGLADPGHRHPQAHACNRMERTGRQLGKSGRHRVDNRVDRTGIRALFTTVWPDPGLNRAPNTRVKTHCDRRCANQLSTRTASLDKENWKTSWTPAASYFGPLHEESAFQVPVPGLFADLDVGAASVALDDEFLAQPADVRTRILQQWMRAFGRHRDAALVEVFREFAEELPDQTIVRQIEHFCASTAASTVCRARRISQCCCNSIDMGTLQATASRLSVDLDAELGEKVCG